MNGKMDVAVTAFFALRNGLAVLTLGALFNCALLHLAWPGLAGSCFGAVFAFGATFFVAPRDRNWQ